MFQIYKTNYTGENGKLLNILTKLTVRKNELHVSTCARF